MGVQPTRRRALGINAVQAAVFETSYGQTPTTGFKRLPFVSNALGEERPLIEDDQLGFGREGLDPEYDVATNDGDVVVPMETRAFGWWLKLLLGDPVSATAEGVTTHTFTSGKDLLPSASIELGNPEIPSYSVNFGALANQLRVSMARSGMLNATIGVIAQGETRKQALSVAGAPELFHGDRFQQATGSIKRGGEVLGSVTAAGFTYSNNFEKVEAIREDGRIDGADPLKAMMTGELTMRFDRLDLYDASVDGTPIDLEFGWKRGATSSLIFTVRRVFLPRVKRPISGPGGIQATSNWQASGAGGHTLTAVLTNDVASY
ncbi:hypothetical protein CA235_01505 [Sphingomonas sp. ABOLF]|uniref:phage tail tube protein n=1 Tax=Sphingomonas sp. ABOLF TaxID=1985879 RepID=UPI000F7ED2B3|nr:phage tail tube protein [Sphingomonas sp. ABOLF]RSV18096.1 hypothetical protein CA235_01505 [Sphingomonas sp. ABOLF]